MGPASDIFFVLKGFQVKHLQLVNLQPEAVVSLKEAPMCLLPLPPTQESLPGFVKETKACVPSFYDPDMLHGNAHPGRAVASLHRSLQ